jgi:hypothetical protein
MISHLANIIYNTHFKSGTCQPWIYEIKIYNPTRYKFPVIQLSISFIKTHLNLQEWNLYVVTWELIKFTFRKFIYPIASTTTKAQFSTNENTKKVICFDVWFWQLVPW